MDNNINNKVLDKQEEEIKQTNEQEVKQENTSNSKSIRWKYSSQKKKKEKLILKIEW